MYVGNLIKSIASRWDTLKDVTIYSVSESELDDYINIQRALKQVDLDMEHLQDNIASSKERRTESDST